MSVNDSPPGLFPADTVTPDLANIIFPSLPLHQYHIIEFYIKPKRREENIFYSISKFLLLLFLHFSRNEVNKGSSYALQDKYIERRGGENSPLTSH